MIHEMKTPLACILMGTRMLKSGKLDIYPDKREKHFQILEDESEHLLSLTNKGADAVKIGKCSIEALERGGTTPSDVRGSH